MVEDGDPPTSVRLLAYSTGLFFGVWIVQIIGDRIGADPRKGNRMSTAKADVLELFEGLEDCSSKEQGRTPTHDELERRLGIHETADGSTKADLLEVLDRLPDDCSLEDIEYSLYVREQIRQGIWSLENEPTFTHEEVEQSLSRWLND